MNSEASATRIQELTYEFTASSAMSANVITISPHTSMTELRSLLKENRISGLPVVEDGNLVGMVSIEDFINWLADDGTNRPVGEMMSTDLVTAFANEPLVDVVRKLERHGFGRLPVVNRVTGKLEGIITKGDIIEKLLYRMDDDFREEELKQYRTSKFFEDIVADKTTLNFYYFIHNKKIEEGGKVASSLRTTLRRLGVNPTTVRKAAILMYEAEMNVIIYAEVGWVTVTVDSENINIEIADKGPGIPDIDQAMQPGFSTAPEWVQELGFGAGMGLVNIKQCAAKMDIDSDVGSGTTLKVSLPTEIPHAS